MAVIALTGIQDRKAFFQRGALSALRYWQGWIADKKADVVTLDKEHNNIIKVISLTLELDEAWPFLCNLIVDFSPYMEKRGSWEMWNWVLMKAIAVAQRFEDKEGEIGFSIQLARLLQRQGHIGEAVVYYRRVIRTARQIADHLSRARAYTNLGWIYLNQSQWRRAEVLCCRALAIFESRNDAHGRAHTENHLGILYTQQRRWDSAQQHLERAYEIWERMGDNHGLMRGCINLGALYSLLERPEKTLFYLKKALHLSQLTGEEAEIAKILLNMAIAFRQNGTLQQAEEYAWQAKALYQRFSNTRGLALVDCNLGSIYIDQQKWQEANRCLEAAIEQARQIHDKFIEVTTLIGLVEYELAKKELQNAFARLETLETFINQNPQFETYRDWHTRLTAQCRSLSREARQTATD